ncbi:MAG: type ISP restriction/modification enzyme [Polyangiales bacterium]
MSKRKSPKPPSPSSGTGDDPAKLSEAVRRAVAAFGAATTPKLASGIGAPEDQMRGPLEVLLRAVAKALRVEVVPIGEASLADLKVRPDYAIEVDRAVCGYLEVKAPQKGADTSKFTDEHDRKQWERLKALPNVLYTSGNEWALYRDGERVGQVARMVGDVRTDGAGLAPSGDELARLLAEFLRWKPTPPRTITQLVQSVARLCRLLRDEVVEALRREASGPAKPFSSLATDWRGLLFPGASDEQFADGYAQTVCFALLLARSDGIDFAGQSVAEIARLLGREHSLMGKALGILTDESTGAFSVTLGTLVRVVGVVDWRRIEKTQRDLYLYLYEKFLEEYDPSLRKETGSYYTPVEVVDAMVRLTDDVLRTRLQSQASDPVGDAEVASAARGFASQDVTVVDPAMGTGTYLLSIIRRVADFVDKEEGPGAVKASLRSLAKRIIGFEVQTGPYAVAELRATEAFREHGAKLPADGMRLYVANTLDNPYVEQTHLGTGYEPIARSRREANTVKREEPIVVVIGNPPYRDQAKGLGGWIEQGDPNLKQATPLDAFRAADNGGNEYVLSNLYVYFWRWATWKVYDAHAEAPAGVVAFITPSGYLTGAGFAGMREYLRRTADEGWIIDLTPEGHQPPQSTRVFPGVQQPLAIAIFIRKGKPDPTTAATIHYLAVRGVREAKFAKLKDVALDGADWQLTTRGWQDTLQPARSRGWTDAPCLDDLMPWHMPGMKANRNWIYAPEASLLRRRWRRLLDTADPDQKKALMKETPDRALGKQGVLPIPGQPARTGPLATEKDGCTPVRVSLRSFDRQFVIPDARVIDRPRGELWGVNSLLQVFATQQGDRGIRRGPAVTFAAHVPEMHHYAGRGGWVHPLWRDADGGAPNLAPGLVDLLATRLGQPVTGEDFVAYLAAVAAHPAFTERFAEDIQTPGLRLPLTSDAALWNEALSVGREVIWLHTYGERFHDVAANRPKSPPRLPSDQCPKVQVAIPDDEDGMPDDIRYDEATKTLHVGKGQVAPVPARVWAYEIDDWRVVRRWFGYRRKDPAAKRTSPLDDDVATAWTAETTTELLNLLNVLGRLVHLEPTQKDLLARIVSSPQIVVADLTDGGVLPVDRRLAGPVTIAPLLTLPRRQSSRGASADGSATECEAPGAPRGLTADAVSKKPDAGDGRPR